jgi:hypothetical protein
MKTSSRDAALALCLPAMLTGMVYLWAFGRAAVKRSNDKQAEAHKAAEKTPSPDTLQAAHQTLEAIERRVVEEREKSVALQRSQAAFAANYAAGKQRSTALSRISKVLNEHDIGLASCSRVETGAPKDVVQLSQKLSAAAPELWRIESVGTYRDMLNALHDLRNASEFIVPLSIEMQPASSDDEDSAQKWSLTVWI